MKHFDMNIDSLHGHALEGGSLYIMKKAVLELALEQHPRSMFTTPRQHAQAESYEFEKKLLTIDERLRRGVDLLVAKLK